jgi:hypothetical protein
LKDKYISFCEKVKRKEVLTIVLFYYVRFKKLSLADLTEGLVLDKGENRHVPDWTP